MAKKQNKLKKAKLTVYPTQKKRSGFEDEIIEEVDTLIEHVNEEKIIDDVRIELEHERINEELIDTSFNEESLDIDAVINDKTEVESKNKQETIEFDEIEVKTTALNEETYSTNIDMENKMNELSEGEAPIYENEVLHQIQEEIQHELLDNQPIISQDALMVHENTIVEDYVNEQVEINSTSKEETLEDEKLTKDQKKALKKENKKLKPRSPLLVGWLISLVIYAILGVAVLIMWPKPKGDAIDPFAYVEVTYKGTSMSGEAIINIIPSDHYTDFEREFISIVNKYYIVEPSYSLETGQLIKLRIDTEKAGEVKDFLDANNYRLSREDTILHVPQLPSYITDMAELQKTAFPVLNETINQEIDLILSKTESKNKGGEILKYYEKQTQSYEGTRRQIAIIFKTFSEEDSGEQAKFIERFHYRVFKEIMVDSSGKVVFEAQDDFSSGDVSLEDAIKRLGSKFTEVELIKTQADE